MIFPRKSPMKTIFKTSSLVSLSLLALLPLAALAQDSETPGSEAEPFIESVQTAVVNDIFFDIRFINKF